MSNVYIYPSQGEIKLGYGDYIVTDEDFQPVDRATYTKVFKVLSEFRFTPSTDTETRYEMILKNIKKMKSNLTITFCPRTVIEAEYVKQSIKNDLKRNHRCLKLFPQDHESHNRQQNTILEHRSKTNCWTLGEVEDPEDIDQPFIEELSFRINTKLSKKLKKDWTFFDILALLTKQIDYFKSHTSTMKNLSLVQQYYQASTATRIMAKNAKNGHLNEMGIENDSDASLLYSAVIVECSDIAKESVLLYRGSKIMPNEERIYYKNSPDIPFRVSYGTGLFAGMIFDGAATSLYYMQKTTVAYVVPVPLKDLDSGPFFIPKMAPAGQLLGYGEWFHASTKAWKNNSILSRGVVSLANDRITHEMGQKRFLNSEIPFHELNTSFSQYMENAILLRSLEAINQIKQEKEESKKRKRAEIGSRAFLQPIGCSSYTYTSQSIG